MPSLRELQLDFLRGALDDDAGAILAALRPDAARAAPRLAVYANNARLAFHGALAAGFPVLRRLTGEAYFRTLARDYQADHPSPAGNLHHVGARLPAWLAARFGGTAYAYFADVAALEWACQEALVAGDAGPLDLARLADVAPADHPHLRLALAPDCRLLRSPWPVFTIWENHQSPAEPPAIDLGAGGEQGLVRRRDNRIVVYRLSAGEFAALAALDAARPLGRALEEALALDPSFDLAVTLPRWVALGIVTGLRRMP